MRTVFCRLLPAGVGRRIGFAKGRRELEGGLRWVSCRQRCSREFGTRRPRSLPSRPLGASGSLKLSGGGAAVDCDVTR